jgi:hypothetical protein
MLKGFTVLYKLLIQCENSVQLRKHCTHVQMSIRQRLRVLRLDLNVQGLLQVVQCRPQLAGPSVEASQIVVGDGSCPNYYQSRYL